MKKKSEWLNQQLVDAKANIILERRACEVTEIEVMEVAAELGIEKPNGNFYNYVHNWQERKLEQTA
ncbi:hypothetical protein [Blastomonas fulva]|uniref:hypothetical protein n=1 Tax=Blastomonas fulva TaxID=1550728 RepID=UPI0025A32B7B|nr:hypothetical protein [Blastomonas fulva]MDM7929825.1 hypothetical protein [Blastomonas fulva]MDM7967478.1 hypothetical protein [Blastomonas fulva]